MCKTFSIKWNNAPLSAAYKFYCAKDLENAHSAEADTQATYEILTAQLDRYQELENDIDFLSEFSQRVNLLPIWLVSSSIMRITKSVFPLVNTKDKPLLVFYNKSATFLGYNKPISPLYKESINTNQT